MWIGVEVNYTDPSKFDGLVSQKFCFCNLFQLSSFISAPSFAIIVRGFVGCKNPRRTGVASEGLHLLFSFLPSFHMLVLTKVGTFKFMMRRD